MSDLGTDQSCDTTLPDAAALAATVAATDPASAAASGWMRPERIEVVLSSDRRREHAPELKARLVTEIMQGRPVSEVSRREGICASVLHRWHKRARLAAGLPVATAAPRLLSVQVRQPVSAEASRPVGVSAAGLEVVLGNGRVLRVPPDSDPVVVAQLAAALER